MSRFVMSLLLLALVSWLVSQVGLQADEGGEGGAKKGRPTPALFQSIDDKAGTLTVKGGEKGVTVYPLANGFKVVQQAAQGQVKEARVADIKPGQPIGLKMNAEGKAVEVITILSGRSGPEGKEAPAPRRPEGKEAGAPRRPEGKEAGAPRRPEGKEAPAPKAPGG
jgi:hypothetical protein